MVGNIYACVYEYATRDSFGSESHLIFENKNKSNSKAKVSFFFLLWPWNFPSVVSYQVQEATKTNKKGKKKRLFSLLPIPAENWDSKACEGQFVEADLPILSMFLGSKGKGVLPIYGNRCKSNGQNCVWKVKKKLIKISIRERIPYLFHEGHWKDKLTFLQKAMNEIMIEWKKVLILQCPEGS